MINKELALWMNADFDNPYVNRLQEMISNKTDYTKYSDKKQGFPTLKT